MNVSTAYYAIVEWIISLCVFIVVFCLIFIMCELYFMGGTNDFGSDSQFVELVWTVVPTGLVLFLAYLNISFLIETPIRETDASIKIIGRQWYWSYDSLEGSYDSYVTDDSFQVDKPLRLQRGVSYRLLITSYDVIHSFSVPALGLKVDAVPGRMNCLYFVPDRYGVFIGYCSELCGTGHAYMPIVVEVVN